VKADIEKVQAAYDIAVDKWDSTEARRFQWYYTFSKMMTDYRLLMAVPLTDKSVLNVGFAEPMDELIFAERCKQWTAIDLHKETVEKAQNWLTNKLADSVLERMDFIQCDATAMLFDDETFDVVFSFSVIDHIPSHQAREKAIAEMARVCKTGGHVIITVPNRWNIPYALWSKKQQKDNSAFFGYEYQFSPLELKKLMKKYHLCEKQFASNFMFTPLAWLPSWLQWIDAPFKYLGYRCGYLSEKI